MGDCYYLDATRNQQGPVPGEEIARLIRSGTIRRDTMIWYAGMPDWRPVGQVDGFASMFARAVPPRPPAAPSRGSFAAAAPSQRMPAMAAAYPGHVEPRMGFGKAIATCFSKYVDFTGRARRKEYWFWHLFYWLALVGLLIIDALIAAVHGPPVLTLLGVLGLFLPTLAGTVRRLHDTDHSGWAMLVSLIPLVGGIIFLVFMCQRGTTGPNRFGPDPLGHDIATAFD
jgi:uncharacterized membrane protein YhaH (DUF805 family)